MEIHSAILLNIQESGRVMAMQRMKVGQYPSDEARYNGDEVDVDEISLQTQGSNKAERTVHPLRHAAEDAVHPSTVHTVKGM